MTWACVGSDLSIVSGCVSWVAANADAGGAANDADADAGGAANKKDTNFYRQLRGKRTAKEQAASFSLGREWPVGF